MKYNNIYIPKYTILCKPRLTIFVYIKHPFTSIDLSNLHSLKQFIALCLPFTRLVTKLHTNYIEHHFVCLKPISGVLLSSFHIVTGS